VPEGPPATALPPLVLATRNPGKVAELTRLLAGAPFRLEGLLAHPEAPEVAETGATYADNALLKARAVAQACGLPALADDSGIEVDALGGRPGVQSARYSGGGAADNVALLLRELRGVPPERRTARFRCVIAVVWPDGRERLVEGSCEGIIAEEPRGEGGFGYDPVFVDPGSGLTFAELSEERKNALSHRARAALSCLAMLRVLADQSRE
jgi:XTP/dITP diphosphohydrolase